MQLQLYIKNSNGDYTQLDLFKDEKVELNLNVKNLIDISKVRSDFTQPFTIPTSPTNNGIFQYWFDADVDGTFNANIRVDAYIELFTIPFKYGSVQLDSCKMAYGAANSYSVTFYGAGVNLSDKFGDDYLKDLDLSNFDHDYNSLNVLSYIKDSELNGSLYYPLINATTYLEAGTGGVRDVLNAANTISYRDFKPALRIIEIIKAIEVKYGVTFSRDFFDRDCFYKLFMWLHKESGMMKTSSTALPVDITTTTGSQINTTTNSVRLDWNDAAFGGYAGQKTALVFIRIFSTSSLNYKIEIFDNGVLYDTLDNLSGFTVNQFYNKSYPNEDIANHLFTFKVSSIEGAISFQSEVNLILRKPFASDIGISGTGTTQTTANAIVKMHEQIPEMKVKEFFSSLINQFNLILRPTSATSYLVDTLDNWYSKGKYYDISNLVDIKEVTIKRPSIKKRIDFVYKNTNTILGKKYFDIYQFGYGDLKATYNITGDELKIESQFENLMFERLVNQSTGLDTNLSCGFSIDLSLNPAKGKPFLFYRNGFEVGNNITIQTTALDKVWHTATEDNIDFNQVASSLNFGDDNSTYFLAPITTGLYYNFWKTYIDDLYNKKTRVLVFKCKLPIRILYNFSLKDRFIIGDKKYKVSSVKVDLMSGDADCEVFTDLSLPADSVNSIIPITVDSTDITVDSELYTVDETSIHLPDTSYIANQIYIANQVAGTINYHSTSGSESFELDIQANTNWALSVLPAWVTANKTSGKKSDYVRLSILKNSITIRTATITVTIGTATFTFTITQAAL